MRSRPGAASTTAPRAPSGNCCRHDVPIATAAPRPTPLPPAARPRHDADRLLVRPDLAVFVSRVRAAARGAGRDLVHGRVPADRLRGAPEGARAQGPGRDRAEARVDVSPG